MRRVGSVGPRDGALGRSCVGAVVILTVAALVGCGGPTAVVQADAAPGQEFGRYGYVPALDEGPAVGEGASWRASRRADGDLWMRLRAGLRLDVRGNERVERQARGMARDRRYLAGFAQRARLYLRLVLGELDRRGLPAELALLPHVESGYNPAATSPKAAAGMWQFIPSTGRIMGLRQDGAFDDRRDILASTRAALDYLEQLHRRLGGDWTLAMAAYNCGPGRVESAQAANRARGLPTDFWSLDLPTETENYVPAILAVARLVAAPGRYGVDVPGLPSAVQVEVVSSQGSLDLGQLARAGGLDVGELRRLNAGLRLGHTRLGEAAQVLVPAGSGQRMAAGVPGALVLPATVSVGARQGGEGLAVEFEAERLHQRGIPDGFAAADVVYRVRAGDSLGGIARRFGVSVGELRRWNPGLNGLVEGLAVRVVPRSGATS